ncbi:MAG: transketolase [Candidatus Neomarinimicrobiota bacterium]
MLKQTADTLRLLAADMVEKANSGHPGLPMGMADCAAVLWTRILVYDPEDPEWPGRDRFVLSGGHGSALLYALLHLAGYDMPLSELKAFRQWGSKTPGHPECDIPGVETTTGPLGQGFANAVGMALAARIAAEQWNDKKHVLFGEHYVYCFCTDGDLMEGISHEAASLAGHLGLGKLICIYDSNRITIDGKTDQTFSEDVNMRFKAYGWQVIDIDGHDHRQIEQAVRGAQKEKGRPTLIIAKTHIGYGSPNKQDSSAAHGAPLGAEELLATKRALGFPETETFYIPDKVRDHVADYVKKVKKIHLKWQKDFSGWKKKNPEIYEAYRRQTEKELPAHLEETLLQYRSAKANSTRAHSGYLLQELARQIPGLIGGSADLAASNLTMIKEGGRLERTNFGGRNIFYEIREFGMGALMNGMALYGSGLIPFGGTFLVFSDYMRSSLRLAAIMKQQVIFVFTHDSIFVGEDGPTHQPVEQLMSLRLIPGLKVLRPADETETAQAWLAALRRKDGPSALVLTRQKCPDLHSDGNADPDFDKGAYILKNSSGQPGLIIAASGSELGIALEAAEKLEREGLAVRVLSVPSLETFLRQDKGYRERLIPPGRTPLVSVEAGVSLGWDALAKNPQLCVGLDHFGASAPQAVLAEKYGLTAEALYGKIKAWLEDGENK